MIYCNTSAFPVHLYHRVINFDLQWNERSELQDEEEESELGMTELMALKEEKERKRKEEEEMRKKKEEAEKEAQEEKERARGVSWGMEVYFSSINVLVKLYLTAFTKG